MNTKSPMPSLLRGCRAAAASLSFALLALVATAADGARKNYTLPSGDAAATLKAFSQQSGEQIVYPVEAVRGVQTKPVTGELSAREALDRMVAGTDLVVVEDAKTGALAVYPKGAAPAAAMVEGSKAVKLEDFRVLGSRIRQTEAAGPSPVSGYDAEYIRSSGAFTLADFLNQIPQTYSGIASGRGSTPNELNPEFGQRTETTQPAFNFVLGSSAAPPGQTGVSGVSLRGLGSGSTLVLVDGRRVAQSGAGNRSTDTRQGFVDLNTIPLGMIERVEVITDGASAIYGADAVAGVINIVLKKNYAGTEIQGSFRTAEHGGGRERNTSVLQGFSHGRLSGSVSLEYFDRQSLKASQRSFSKNQNHTGIPTSILLADGSTRYGNDFRLNWGYPAVIQASGGVVSGNFDAIPGIRVVAVPVGSTQTPSLSQFIPITTNSPNSTTVNGTGQRRFNTAPFLDLIPESQRIGASTSLNYRINDRLDAFATARTSKVTSVSNAQVAGNSITGGFGSAATLPAALNPFNQNVLIGMVLPEWGAANQRVRTLADAVTAGVRGSFGQTWQWEIGGSYQLGKTRQKTRNYNSAGFVPLLTNADPAQRFNPFIDYTAPGAPSQAALLETLSTYPELNTESTATGFDFTADGDLFPIWGGDVKMAVGASTSTAEVYSQAINYSSAAVPVASTVILTSEQDSKAVFTEFQVPLFGKNNARPLARRLDLQVAGRREEIGPFSATVPKYGFTWAPVDSVLLRGSWSEGFRAPGVTEYLFATTTTTSTLSDPRRTPTSTTGVIVTGGANPNPKPEKSTNSFAGLVYEPRFVKGLSLQVNYYDTEQRDVLQLLSAQTIVNNEALFTDRIVRAAPTATDSSLNQPGQITAVSRVFVNFGEVKNRSLDVLVDYVLPIERFGRWHANIGASRTLEATRALAPGQPPVILDDDTAAPPQWKVNGSLFWRGGDWNASLFLWYMDGFRVNSAGNALVANNASVTYFPTPSVTKLDVRVGYEFRNGVWRHYGKGLRVGFGVNNVFDKEPPFSDTVWGFNAGLHSQLILGRAYEFSFVLPL